MIAAALANTVVRGVDPLQRNSQKVEVSRDLGEPSLDSVTICADLDSQAEGLFGVPHDQRKVSIKEGLAAEECDSLGAVLVAHDAKEIDRLSRAERVVVLQSLTVEAVQALEVAAIEQLQIHHADLADAGYSPDHMGLPTASSRRPDRR